MTKRVDQSPDTSLDLVKASLNRTRANLEVIRDRLKRPLSLSEKILLGHLERPDTQYLARGEATLSLLPDRVAMQDATAQMAMLQFMQAGISKVQVPSTIHCDHLIQAHSGAKADMKNALVTHKEVYEFLESAARKHGLGFWGPGAGIIHQVVLEKYAFPGGLIIGTDSHTPNAGGLGMLAIGVGGADAAEVMAGLPWEVLHPKLIGVKLTGRLSGWAAPKDVILKVCELLTVKGGTNAIVEYFGDGCESISCTGKGTICNMGAEHGATTSVFAYDESMRRYLRVTERQDLIDLLDANADLLRSDDEVNLFPEKFYDRVIEIDLSTLEPHIVGPHTPDLARSVSEMAKDVKSHKYPSHLAAALIGSCTNSSYEDIKRVVDVAQQALDAGMKAPTTVYVTPGSDQVFETMQKAGFVDVLERVGAVVLANACGPCIGQWKRDHMKPGEKNSIINSYNRNFPRRNDGSADTLSFIASPEIVMALGLAGDLSFNPLQDTLRVDGKTLKFKEPSPPEDIPPQGFVISWAGYVAPPETGEDIEVSIQPSSERLALLPPFHPWSGDDFVRLPILLKAKGKCTTDHISPAGPWLRFRGHLDRISDNMFSGAQNAFAQEPGKGLNVFTGEREVELSKLARDYKERDSKWVVVGDENYGEGSSREHAAMEPRYLGAVAIIARSFARIHETNLKKQGVLPLHFVDPSDYEKIEAEDRVSILGLKQIEPKKDLQVEVTKKNGQRWQFQVRHTLTARQIDWFKAGSALNAAREAA
jgi:aconitate hydratase